MILTLSLLCNIPSSNISKLSLWYLISFSGVRENSPLKFSINFRYLCPQGRELISSGKMYLLSFNCLNSHFNSYHHHVALFILKMVLLLLFSKPPATFFSLFDGQYVASIAVKVHVLGTLSHVLAFLVGFIIYSAQFKVLLGVDADDADDSVLDILEFVETELFTYSLVSLTELSEEFPGQIQPMLCCCLKLFWEGHPSFLVHHMDMHPLQLR